MRTTIDTRFFPVLLFISLFMLSSCNPQGHFPIFTIETQDETIMKRLTEEADYIRDAPIAINDNCSVILNGYDHTRITVFSKTLEMGTSFELGKENDPGGFYTAYHCGGEREYIIIHSWVGNISNVTRYQLHQGSAVVFLDDLSVKQFEAGIFPVIIRNNSVYYFDTLSIYQSPLDEIVATEALYTLPFDKRIPNWSSADPPPDLNIRLYTFTVSEQGIRLSGENTTEEDINHEFSIVNFE